MNAPSAAYERPEPGWRTYALGLVLGATVSTLLAAVWLGLTPAWVAALVGGIAAFVGILGLDNLGEALVLSVMVALVLLGVVWALPEFALVRFVVLPGAVGFCAGEVVVGVWKELAG